MKEKVLVYDSNRLARDVIAQVIVDLFPDSAVEVAGDPIFALELLRKGSYGLVISGYKGNGEICGADILFHARKMSSKTVTVLASSDFESEYPGKKINDVWKDVDFFWSKSDKLIEKIQEFARKAKIGGV